MRTSSPTVAGQARTFEGVGWLIYYSASLDFSLRASRLPLGGRRDAVLSQPGRLPVIWMQVFAQAVREMQA